MRVREVLEAAQVNENQRLMFIIGEAGSYRTTPVRYVWEWLRGGSDIAEYIVLNPSQPPVVSVTTQHWLRSFNDGSLLCMFVSPEAAIRAEYSERQAEQILAMYDKSVKEALNA